MVYKPILNIFKDPQSITASLIIESGERLQIPGVAQLTEMPFLEIQFPKSKINKVKKINKQEEIVLTFEVDYSVLTLYTHLSEEPETGTLLLEIDRYEQKKQERISTRIPVPELWAEYRPVDERGHIMQGQASRVEVINLSKTGILLAMSEVIHPDQRLELSILFSERRIGKCFGRVVRLALQSTGRMETAIHFDEGEGSGLKAIKTYCEEQKKAFDMRKGLSS